MALGCPRLCPAPPGLGQPPELLLQVLASAKAGAAGEQMGTLGRRVLDVPLASPGWEG